MQLAHRGHPNLPLAFLGTDVTQGSTGRPEDTAGKQGSQLPPKGGLGRGIRPLRTGHPGLLQDPHKVREVP